MLFSADAGTVVSSARAFCFRQFQPRSCAHHSRQPSKKSPHLRLPLLPDGTPVLSSKAGRADFFNGGRIDQQLCCNAVAQNQEGIRKRKVAPNPCSSGDERTA